MQEPTNLEELLILGSEFGGWVVLAPLIKNKLETGEPLEFENGQGLKIRVSTELAIGYVDWTVVDLKIRSMKLDFAKTLSQIKRG